MNDLTFPNYENYFSTTSQQMTDVISLTQNAEYDELPSTIHYLSNVSCDMAPLPQASTEEQRHQQTNLFNFIPNTYDEQPQQHEGQTTANRTSSSGVLGAVGNSNNVFVNIPFVQIHTTDVQPQRTSYGNVFRRNISRQDEIKSEPIKSENAEAAKDRTNATPTPPRAINQAQTESSTKEKQATNIDNINTEETSCPILQIYKCSQCPFISLRDTERDDHVTSQHAENVGAKIEERLAINCPGCSNVFFNQDCLDIHLKLDHLMRDDEILKLMNIFVGSSRKTIEDRSPISDTINNTNTNIAKAKEPIRKSRIYLKNVDCLREPNRQPMEQTDNQLAETNTSQPLEPNKINPPKQKISIKSVDVLREPALLRRDYEMQSSNINNFINFNTEFPSNNIDLMNTPLHVNPSSSYDYSQSSDGSINKTNSNCNESVVSSNIGKKPRRPKIYVKSVESFNLMPISSLHATSNTSQVYDSNGVHIPYMFDANSTGNILNSSGNFNNQNDMDTFQYNNSSNINNNYILDNSLFLCNSEDINENCDQIENITLVPDTTPTPPTAYDVNSIMDKQRGTLHLRTVDELNLMNKTEVQHLIAPNLDNHHNGEILEKVNSSSLSDINLIGDALYEDDNFKFHDLDTQMVNDWPETYEDLAEDINCIIADASNENSVENLAYITNNNNNNQKISTTNFDIEPPQVSLITIRDIEELTGTTNHVTLHGTVDHHQGSIVEQIQNSHDVAATEIDINKEPILVPEQNNDENASENNLKRELTNATPDSNEVSIDPKTGTVSKPKETTNKILTSTSEIPPLVPVTNITSDLCELNVEASNVEPVPSSNIPMPPLVPVSPVIKLNSGVNNPPNKSILPLEKGRIYVANNLMDPSKRPIAVSATSGTSVRGRPFGSNRTRITKLKQSIGISAEDLFSKCSVKGCAFRFKKAETVEYHRKCHDNTTESPQAMLCPECKSTDFNNWNTLHTHLWRAHQIDMELYKCELCEFKTPIFSRLVNTHAKIHFDDRNYKCEQCEKAFKNSKQLKNHRRWHRVHGTTVVDSNMCKTTPTEIHRCSDCGSTFSQQKTLREHCCKKGETSLKCEICEKLMSSKSSLKLHLLTHSDGEKRHKCQNCDYATNDHNAFRRHRMGHENRKMYECTFCPYKSVQSVAYQKHIQQKHPENADSVIHKCSACSYSTINRSLLIVHQAKHDMIIISDNLTKPRNFDDLSSPNSTENSITNNATELQKSKIKVKSNLFTTNINEVTVNITNDELNLVQLYNSDIGSVT